MDSNQTAPTRVVTAMAPDNMGLTQTRVESLSTQWEPARGIVSVALVQASTHAAKA